MTVLELEVTVGLTLRLVKDNLRTGERWKNFSMEGGRRGAGARILGRGRQSSKLLDKHRGLGPLTNSSLEPGFTLKRVAERRAER